MPGFKINGEGDGPDSKAKILRVHRFSLKTFMGKPGNKEPFNMVKDVDLPERIIEELLVKTPGATYKFGKQASYSDLIIVFYVPHLLVDEIEILLDKVHTPEEGIGDFDSYINEVSLDITDEKGSMVNNYTFKNAWVSSIKKNQLTYGSSEMFLLTTTVKFSWYEWA